MVLVDSDVTDITIADHQVSFSNGDYNYYVFGITKWWFNTKINYG